MSGQAAIWADHPLLAIRRLEFLGAPLHALTMAETLALASEAMSGHRPLHHVVINVSKLINMRKSKELFDDVAGAGEEQEGQKNIADGPGGFSNACLEGRNDDDAQGRVEQYEQKVRIYIGAGPVEPADDRRSFLAGVGGQAIDGILPPGHHDGAVDSRGAAQLEGDDPFGSQVILEIGLIFQLEEGDDKGDRQDGPEQHRKMTKDIVIKIT